MRCLLLLFIFLFMSCGRKHRVTHVVPVASEPQERETKYAMAATALVYNSPIDFRLKDNVLAVTVPLPKELKLNLHLSDKSKCVESARETVTVQLDTTDFTMCYEIQPGVFRYPYKYYMAFINDGRNCFELKKHGEKVNVVGGDFIKTRFIEFRVLNTGYQRCTDKKKFSRVDTSVHASLNVLRGGA